MKGGMVTWGSEDDQGNHGEGNRPKDEHDEAITLYDVKHRPFHSEPHRKNVNGVRKTTSETIKDVGKDYTNDYDKEIQKKKIKKFIVLRSSIRYLKKK